MAENNVLSIDIEVVMENNNEEPCSVKFSFELHQPLRLLELAENYL